MTLTPTLAVDNNFSTSPQVAPQTNTLGPRITVVGVGGAGNNAINNMIRYKLQGVDYMACNTDAQHLEQSLVSLDRRIQLGLEVTQGLGAGSHPDVGRAAAEESLEDVIKAIKGSNMVFVTAGMGGGTGTGAAPVIAQAAREMGILTVGVVTKPFSFEGPHRMKMAEKGIKELEQYVDTLIIIPNQNLFRIATDKTTFADAFKIADDVLYSGVRGVTDLMIMPGLVNLDFADIRAVMTEMGKAMMGTGEATGEGRAISAAEAAISNPLLDDVSMRGAKGILINITGGMDMTLFEVDEAANRIREEIDADTTVETNIIFGSTFDESMNGVMRVSVVATGIDSEEVKRRLAESALQHSESEEIDLNHENIEKTVFDTDNDTQSGNDLTLDDDVFDNGEDTQSSNVVNLEGHKQHKDLDHNEYQDINAKNLTDQKTKEDAQNSKELHPDHNDESHHNLYAQNKRRRGFFGRFVDTLTGKTRNTQEDHYQATTHTTTQSSINEDLFSDIDAAELHDVPAYLRRKSK